LHTPEQVTRATDLPSRSLPTIEKNFEILEKCLTPERMLAHFEGNAKGPVYRYSLPQLGALNFVMHNALGGGVTRSLALDAHGKCLSAKLLSLEIE
jgi:hypothetical protein